MALAGDCFPGNTLHCLYRSGLRHSWATSRTPFQGSCQIHSEQDPHPMRSVALVQASLDSCFFSFSTLTLIVSSSLSVSGISFSSSQRTSSKASVDRRSSVETIAKHMLFTPPPFDQVHSTVAISRDKSNSTSPTIIKYRSTSEPWPVQTSLQVQGHQHDQMPFNSLFLPRSSIHAPAKRTTTDPPHQLTTMNSQAQCKRQLEAPARIECLLVP